MAKKERVPIQRSGDLEAIDLELDEAIGRLSGANEKIVNLLQSIESSGEGGVANTNAEEGSGEDDSDEDTSKSPEVTPAAAMESDSDDA